MNFLERGIAVLCQVLVWISTVVIFVILVANTVLRYATGSSLQWANEVPELLFPWLVMAGVVLAALHGAHITTSFLMDTVPPGVRRVVSTAVWLCVAGLYACSDGKGSTSSSSSSPFISSASLRSWTASAASALNCFAIDLNDWRGGHAARLAGPAGCFGRL